MGMRGEMLDGTWDIMAKVGGHTLSVTGIVGAILGIVPGIAAAFAIVFYCVQLYESKTMQRWLTRRRHRKIIRLRSRVRELEIWDEKVHDDLPSD